MNSVPPRTDEPRTDDKPEALGQVRGAAEVPPPPMPVLAQPWSARQVEPMAGDLALVHRWMSEPHVAEFWQQAWPLDRWRQEISDQLAGVHFRPLLISWNRDPVGYVEVYRVLRDRLAGCYRHEPHDLGVHIAIGEIGRTGRGLGRALLRVLAEGLLTADPGCRRVVAEPDIANDRSVRCFTAAGFRLASEVVLPEKTAALLVFPRNDSDVPR